MSNAKPSRDVASLGPAIEAQRDRVGREKTQDKFSPGSLKLIQLFPLDDEERFGRWVNRDDRVEWISLPTLCLCAGERGLDYVVFAAGPPFLL
jgi:hypothetical protein